MQLDCPGFTGRLVYNIMLHFNNLNAYRALINLSRMNWRFGSRRLSRRFSFKEPAESYMRIRGMKVSSCMKEKLRHIDLALRSRKLAEKGNSNRFALITQIDQLCVDDGRMPQGYLGEIDVMVINADNQKISICSLSTAFRRLRTESLNENFMFWIRRYRRQLQLIWIHVLILFHRAPVAAILLCCTSFST